MLGRGEELPFATGSVDLVTMCEVVEHIEDVEPLCREAARVLAPARRAARLDTAVADA